MHIAKVCLNKKPKVSLFTKEKLSNNCILYSIMDGHYQCTEIFYVIEFLSLHLKCVKMVIHIPVYHFLHKQIHRPQLETGIY